MTEPRITPIRWALVGYSKGGRIYHRPLISSAISLDLVAVVTRNAARQDQVRQDLPGAASVASLAELIEHGVQGVTISTPPATHAPLAHAALDLGLHVVVDKPFALTAADAVDLATHAAGVGRTLTPYHNRRWDSDLLTVQKLISDNALGTVHSFISRIDRVRAVGAGWQNGPAAEGGGMVLGLAPHLVDQAIHLFGPVVTVHAQLRTIRPNAGAEDDIELHLTHRSGTRSTLVAGLASPAPGPRFLVNGSAAGFVINGFDIQEEQLKAGDSPTSLGEKWGLEPETAWGQLHTNRVSRTVPSERGRWDTFYPAVARAVAGLDQPPVAADDAVATAAVLDAVRISCATGAVITL